MENGLFRFSIGQFKCVAIKDGDDWDRNVLLVNNGQQLVLIDTGTGYTTSPPGLLINRLRVAEVSPDDIDVVVLSHADFDHIGGAVDANGKVAFPHARYVLSREEWAFWSSKPKRLRASETFDEEFLQRLHKAPEKCLAQLRDTLELINPDTEILPGIRSVAAPGHTPGYLAIYLSSDDNQLLFIGDLIRDPKDVENPDWYSVFDYEPEQVIATQHRLVSQAAKERILIMATHLPFPGLGYVESNGLAWRWKSYDVSD